jgi:hypothetical protein
MDFPVIRRPIAARLHQAMQHSQKDGTLHGELETPGPQQILEDGLAARLLPEPFKDQHRAQTPGRGRRQVTSGPGRQDQEMLGKAAPGGQQTVDMAGLFQVVEATEGGEDALSWPAVNPVVFDDLEIDAWPGFFSAKEHGGLQYPRIQTLLL